MSEIDSAFYLLSLVLDVALHLRSRFCDTSVNAIWYMAYLFLIIILAYDNVYNTVIILEVFFEVATFIPHMSHRVLLSSNLVKCVQKIRLQTE